MPTELKLLCLCDSPTTTTGFARVIQNLLPHWAPHFARIDLWGIGYQGWPHDLPCRIFPSTTFEDREWQSDGNLQRFLGLLAQGDYTHLWVMQDLFHIARMAGALKEVCEQAGVRSVLYYPVDAPIPAHWVKAIRAVDVAVAYTEYGYTEVKRHREAANLPKRIIPHGTDLGIYKPHDRAASRKYFTDGSGRRAVGPDDFLIAAVSAHQKRKDLFHTLDVFRALRGRASDEFGEMKLYLHMPPVNQQEGSNLKALALEMGIGDAVLFADNMFRGNVAKIGEDALAMIYSAANLLLTTTHGEGWGLPITEAMACGVPVAGPAHTAVAELLGGGRRGIMLSCPGNVVLPNDNMRIRPVVDTAAAAEAIHLAFRRGLGAGSPGVLAADAFAWVNQPEFRWENIAREWLNLMEVGNG